MPDESMQTGGIISFERLEEIVRQSNIKFNDEHCRLLDEYFKDVHWEKWRLKTIKDYTTEELLKELISRNERGVIDRAYPQEAVCLEDMGKCLEGDCILLVALDDGRKSKE